MKGMLPKVAKALAEKEHFIAAAVIKPHAHKKVKKSINEVRRLRRLSRKSLPDVKVWRPGAYAITSATRRFLELEEIARIPREAVREEMALKEAALECQHEEGGRPSKKTKEWVPKKIKASILRSNARRREERIGGRGTIRFMELAL